MRWSVAVLIGVTVCAVVLTGAFWLALRIPGRSPDQVVPVPASPAPTSP